MNKQLFKYETAGFIFVSVFGTVNHFLYELFGNSVFIGLFCPVNESIWEHQKLLFFPYILWSIIEYFLLKKPACFFPAKTAGIISAVLFCTAFYYTYTGITGAGSIFFDVLSFYLAAGVSFIISYMMIKNCKKSNVFIANTAVFIMILLAAIFFVFTFAPPLIPLFKDPLTSTYGI